MSVTTRMILKLTARQLILGTVRAQSLPGPVGQLIGAGLRTQDGDLPCGMSPHSIPKGEPRNPPPLGSEAEALPGAEGAAAETGLTPDPADPGSCPSFGPGPVVEAQV